MALKLAYDNTLQRGDLVVVAGSGFQRERGLESLVLVSLFTWAQAGADEGNRDPENPLGWWGDSFPDVEGYRIAGSRLWLIRDRVANQQTLNLAKQYAEEALQWMVDDGIAKKVIVDVAVEDSRTLAFTVGIVGDLSAAPQFLGPWLFQLTQAAA